MTSFRESAFVSGPRESRPYIVNYRAGYGRRKAPNKWVVLRRYGPVTTDKARNIASMPGSTALAPTIAAFEVADEWIKDSLAAGVQFGKAVPVSLSDAVSANVRRRLRREGNKMRSFPSTPPS